MFHAMSSLPVILCGMCFSFNKSLSHLPEACIPFWLMIVVNESRRNPFNSNSLCDNIHFISFIYLKDSNTLINISVDVPVLASRLIFNCSPLARCYTRHIQTYNIIYKYLTALITRRERYRVKIVVFGAQIYSDITRFNN